MQNLLALLVPVVFILAGLIIGKAVELRHFRRLDEAERQYRDMIMTNLKTVPPQFAGAESFLVMGAAVIATDYFKVFAAGLRTLFGGEIKSYATLMERARRQAVVRMLEQARSQGARVVWNVRYETSTTQGQQQKKPGGVEILVYGTAFK
jgi:uncharacterized protein YbjQ (UPF0145 family)